MSRLKQEKLLSTSRWGNIEARYHPNPSLLLIGSRSSLPTWGRLGKGQQHAVCLLPRRCLLFYGQGTGPCLQAEHLACDLPAQGSGKKGARGLT